MKGTFFCDDADGITFLRFYPDGSVVIYGKTIVFDQILTSFPWLRVDSDRVNFGRGKYYINAKERIRIRAEGTLGKLDYREIIKNIDRIDFRFRCLITNYRKMETFQRFSEKEHIIRFEVNQRNNK